MLILVPRGAFVLFHLEALVPIWVGGWWRPHTLQLAYELLELSIRWYTVVYIPDIYIECLPRVS